MYLRLGLLGLTFLIYGSCNYTIRAKNGDEAFELKEYHTALQFYSADFKKEEDSQLKGALAYKMGICCEKKGDFPQSLRWFKRAYDLDYGPSALEQYAFALKQNEEYEAAIAAFEQLESETKQNGRYRRDINICKLSISWKQKIGSYKYIVHSAQAMNTPAAEYGALYGPEQKMYFLSDREASKDLYKWTGRPYTNIYEYNLINLQSPGLLPYPINSENNEGPISLNLLGNELYFTRCIAIDGQEDFCHIFYSKKINDIWTDPELLDMNLLDCNTIHPALHENGRSMVFSSDRVGGNGKYDLFIMQKGEEGWSKPILFPEGINTEGNETFPIWHKDTLYFSSDYISGMGGLDIFKTFLSTDSTWVAPYHLDWPINSGSDDFLLNHDPNFISNDSIRTKGVFSSNRNSAQKDDIFFFEERPMLIPSNGQKNEQGFAFTIFITFHFVESEKYREHPSVQKDLDSIYVYIDESTNPIFTGQQNTLKLKLREEDHYQFKFAKSAYLNQMYDLKTISIPISLEKDSVFHYTVDIELTPLHFNEEFVLKDVYYDFDKWDIREEAKPSLNQLAHLLKANPLLNIRLSSHTDCRGDEVYNESLSYKRGNSCKEYLSKLEIEKERLYIEAKGEHDLAIECLCEECTEIEHQLNRRTTFKFIRK